MPDFALRAARPSDADALAHIHMAGRDAIPLPILHDLEDVARYHAGLIERADVRVAVDSNDRALGYAAREGDMLAQLYVAPNSFRTGIGAALLAAMRRESALRLWCFAHNHRALAFYRSFDAVEIGRELGPENEEGLPALMLAFSKL